MKTIEQLHKFADQGAADLAKASAKNGKPVTCAGKGCCHCCYEPVYCSTAEVEHILEKFSEDDKRLLGKMIAQDMDRIKASGLLNKEQPPVLEWLAMKLPCIFLDLHDGTCSVYERRPYSCRLHMAVRDPQMCRDDRMNQKYPQSTELEHKLGHMIIEAHAEKGIIEFDNMLVLLHNALNGEHVESASHLRVELSVDKLYNSSDSITKGPGTAPDPNQKDKHDRSK